ncbi:Cof-type HAD-IIB family hydrolase [Cutibacterium avidum]|uniref:Cof-type HAD-IIB family hydrolase n=1 Tax=Cutibacterium avidum TaxID=33010 RepID=UPI0008F55F14|nr:Cof-type HAD-IIB family hydrolase [Cutibacterium avidum]MCO6664440.1 Cof-type HAD-IIB family hydrolase [Cutibacterium avidum]MDK7697771.1 Cof-type HAD-IIB family hydrolase [Cutibacterium avidum]OIJ79553.1 hydrolase [Cutibacterium avidum]
MLIATDLDGTLLTPEGTISPRTRDAIRAAERVGVPVVPVTARQIYGIEKWRDDLGRWALCSNGAICWDLQAHTVLFRQLMSAAVANEFAHRLLASAPGIRFLTIKDDGLTFASQRGYAGLTTFADHSRDPSDMPALDLDEVLDGDCLKMVARHPSLPIEELAARAAGVGMTDEVHVTTSGKPMLEISAKGVTKDSGLAMLCDHLGIDQRDTVAFGDGANDVEMLEWAGDSYAMANAVPLAVEAARHRAPSNAEDGVAKVVEELLAVREQGDERFDAHNGG